MQIKKILSIFEDKESKFYYFFLLIIFFSITIIFFDIISIFAFLPIISLLSNRFDKTIIYQEYIPGWAINALQGLDIKSMFVLLIFILFLRNIFFLVNNFIIYRFAKYIEIDTSKKSFFLVLRYSYLEITQKKSSELIKNLRDLVGGYILYIDTIIRIVSDLIISILFSLLLFYISFKETFILFSYFIFIFILFSKILSKISYKEGKKLTLASEKINLTIINVYKNFPQILIRNLRKKFMQIYISNVNEASYSRLIINFLKSNIKPFLEILVLIFIIVIFLIFDKVNYLNKEHNNVISLISVYILAAYRLLPITNSIVNSFVRINNYQYAYNLVTNNLKLFNQKYRNLEFKEKVTKKINFEKSLILRNINFKYSNSKKYLFKKLNFVVKKNQMTGIVGQSGEGKSTLIKIMLGLIKPDQGEIIVDGNRILNSNIVRYQQLFSYLPQQNLFMPDSIKNNISLSSNIIDETKVIDSLKKTNCLNFVNKLKEGINHKLNEDGKNFSSGQLQRLALARTLYFDSDIIILDEPTSSLDITAEENFVRLIKTLKNFKTIIIISHKYKTLKNCDKIYRLNKNKLILVKKNPQSY